MRRALLAALLALPAAAQAQGEAWRPERGLTIVLPYAPGSAADAYARAMGDFLGRRFGQAVAVVNRDGGSGTVGMRFVAQAPADGLTLGITPMTPIVVQPHMVRNLGIGPESFAPVCGIAENILGVVVRAGSPLRDLSGLAALARARPLQYGSPGPNSLPFLGVWRLQRAAGVEMTHVAFRGDPPSMNEVMGGRLDFAAVVVASASELIGSGHLRLLGVFSDRRHPDFPAVPTAREQGLDAEQLSFVGMYAPAARRNARWRRWRKPAAFRWTATASGASPRRPTWSRRSAPARPSPPWCRPSSATTPASCANWGSRRSSPGRRRVASPTQRGTKGSGPRQGPPETRGSFAEWFAANYSTVTLFARLRGWSTSVPFSTATW